MKSAKRIENLISKINVIPDSQLEQKTLEDILLAQEKSKKMSSAKSPPNIWRIIMKSRMTKLAVAAIVIIVVLVVFNSSDPTLYAQVIKAAKKARTVHITGLSPKDGQLQIRNETWYERGAGIKTAWKRNEQDQLMLDDGDFRWEYSQGNTFAVRHKSLGIDDLPREITEPGHYLNKCTRDTSGDMIINGLLCKLYTGFYSGKSDSTRLMFWIDQHNQFRRFEEKILEDGVWKTVEVCQVEYDIDFEESIFQPDFGSDIKIVKANDMLNKPFELEDALFKTEEMGLIFAVHELKRCQNDLIFTVTSLRPTEATRQEIKDKQSAAWNYGNYQLGSCEERIDDNWTGYSPRELAWIYHNGFLVRWTVFIPTGFEKVDQCKFELYYLYARGKLAAKRKNAGLPDRIRFNPIATLPLPDTKVDLESQISNVYNLVKALEPIVGEKRLLLKSIPFTDKEMIDWIKEYPDDGIAKTWNSGSKDSRLLHGQSKQPSQISEGAWIEDRLSYIGNFSKD